MVQPSGSSMIPVTQLSSRSASLTGGAWDKIFLFLVGSLSSTILLKIAQVQFLEIVYGLQICLLIVDFGRSGGVLRLYRPFFRLAQCYLFFCCLALSLAIAALRFDFYYPDELSLLKYPVMITLSRTAELIGSVFIMLYLADRVRRDAAVGRFVMRVYFLFGWLSALFSVLSYPLDVLGIASLGTYSGSHRMRGFYNEGGPYGLYLISVFLTGFALYKMGWIGKGYLGAAYVLLTAAFIGSQSKAALLALVAIFVVNGLLARSLRQRVLVACSIAFILFLAFQFVNFGRALRIYQTESEAYERLSHQHAKDPNFVLGRVAGAFIVPRMILQHPLLGIGWGNYALLRNAPNFRGASVYVRQGDEPGLGIAGTASELGLPLTVYLEICLLLPAFWVRRWQSYSYLVNMALLQPIVHLFGSQLNLTYPWIVTAFALGLASLTKGELAKAPAVQSDVRLSPA